jgi:hypothetical protein
MSVRAKRLLAGDSERRRMRGQDMAWCQTRRFRDGFVTVS